MTSLLLFDIRVDPVTPLPWSALIVLLVVIFFVAVIFVAALVFLLIRFKRGKVTEQTAGHNQPALAGGMSVAQAEAKRNPG